MDYLKSRDKRLGEVIDKLGWVPRPTINGLFPALVHSIIGQQISTKAHQTIWKRMTGALGEITPENLLALSDAELLTFGMTFDSISIDPYILLCHEAVPIAFQRVCWNKWTVQSGALKKLGAKPVDIGSKSSLPLYDRLYSLYFCGVTPSRFLK